MSPCHTQREGNRVRVKSSRVIIQKQSLQIRGSGRHLQQPVWSRFHGELQDGNGIGLSHLCLVYWEDYWTTKSSNTTLRLKVILSVYGSLTRIAFWRSRSDKHTLSFWNHVLWCNVGETDRLLSDSPESTCKWCHSHAGAL